MTSKRSRREMFRLGGGLLVAGGALAGTGLPAAADGSPVPRDAWDLVPRILRRIRPPEFPARTFDITRFGAVGDGTTDCIAVKAGRDEDGHRVGVPSTNIVAERCKFAGRWGGITVGSEMSGGVRNVFARHCEINPADFPGHFPVKYPLYVKTNKLRGGYIDGVHLRDFTGGRVEREALYVILNYNNQVGTRPVDVRNLTVERMVLDGARRAVWLNGLETDHIRTVEVRNSHFTNVTDPANMINFVDGLTFANVTVNGTPTVP